MQQLRKLRKAKCLSMKELGKLFGLAESTISLYENGKRQPDTETIKRLAEFFSVSVDYLLGVEKEKTPPGNDLPEDVKQLVELVMELSEDEVNELSNYIDYIISKRK